VLKWGAGIATARVDGAGFHTAEERERKLAGRSRRQYLRDRGIVVERQSKQERLATPGAFRDLLLDIARSCRP
jgi:hypothetical protein